jgi:glycosyltransferase involved in cell wall biosynthesis
VSQGTLASDVIGGGRVEPRVAVVIPAWSAYAGPELVEAVASVRAQSVPAELIVVDNASEVALPPLEGVELVRLAQRRSTGAARNAALECVRTPYVVFLDADDLLLEGALAALVEGLEAAAGRSVHTLSIIDGLTGRRYRSPRRFGRVLSHGSRLFALFNTVWSLLPTQGCTIMRVSDVRECGGYGDSVHGEDWVLAVSIAFRGAVSFDNRPGLLYRRRSDSPGATGLSGRVLLENAARVRARIREDPAIPGWVRLLLPAITLAQWLAARGAHPLYRSVRSLFARLLPGRGTRGENQAGE